MFIDDCQEFNFLDVPGCPPFGFLMILGTCVAAPAAKTSPLACLPAVLHGLFDLD